MSTHTEYRQDHTVVTDDSHPNMRFIVMHDEVASDPIAESGANVEHYVVRAGYHSLTSDPTGELSETFARFNDTLDDPLSAMRRYLVIFHGWSEERAESQVTMYHHTGYSQGDWADLLVIVPDDGYGTADSWAREWSMWAQGDVFFVTAERFIECESDECHGDDESHWDSASDQGIEFEAFGGIYADDAESAARVYLEQVNVS